MISGPEYCYMLFHRDPEILEALSWELITIPGRSLQFVNDRMLLITSDLDREDIFGIYRSLHFVINEKGLFILQAEP
ncbi:MAG: hypothetical protein EA392_09810 [Cryomorphaceae bacterium]|nr:MAG: hypothetical protein EA392_09810 [Cryomorphaceae bacterium]